MQAGSHSEDNKVFNDPQGSVAQEKSTQSKLKHFPQKLSVCGFQRYAAGRVDNL